MSNENSPNSLPLDAMTFVRKYGGDLFYKDFAIKKSDEFADQLLLQIKQFIDPKIGKISIGRSTSFNPTTVRSKPNFSLRMLMMRSVQRHGPRSLRSPRLQIRWLLA